VRAFQLPHKRLKRAIVTKIDVPPITQSDASYGDMVHEQVGRALATEIATTPELFRSKNDIVSVGSGRAIHAVIDSLQQFSHFQVDEITIMSLTGSLFFQDSTVKTEFLLDADILKSNEFSFVFLRRWRFGDGRRPIAL
jgi:DNA-binding transcriptional regulator LsrR (DeoR family)